MYHPLFPQRKAILHFLCLYIAEEAGTPVSVVLEHLKVQGAWVFMRSITKRADNGEVAWERSPASESWQKMGCPMARYLA